MTFKRPQRYLSAMIVLLCLCCWHPLTVSGASSPAPFKEGVQGGVGLQVVPVASGEIVVIAVLPKSPAAKAKILPGDLIVSVDGKALRGSKFADITKTRLWGKAGSKVKITWLRPGVAGKKNAQLQRTALKDDPAQDLAVKMLLPAEAIPPKGVKP